MDCPGTKNVIGGGWVTSGAGTPGFITISSNQATDSNTWNVIGELALTVGDASYSLAAFVICAQP